MRLKSLELVGFKSFADRTVINFEEGITGVVGPNGCGKSNVVDAIRWVMGEQSAKHLRGGSMEDVIFNGSEKRPQMGMASVSLTFDNGDGRAPAEYASYSEITVGRRLYRSGESEYSINKTPCRHKDIIDLFLGTGIGTKAYSIVEQGRISQIVSARPEERRFYIEEAAGISKFKNRKESAMRKVEATKANLLRLSDIIAELERQLNSLSRQAKKAERYQEYFMALKGIELQVAAYQWQQENDLCQALVQQLTEWREQEAGTATDVATVETEIETGRLGLAELERQVAEMQERVYGLQNNIRILETDLNYQKKEATDLAERVQSTTTQVETLRLKVNDYAAAVTQAQTEQTLVVAGLAENQAAVAEQEAALMAVVAERDQVEAELTQAQARLLETVRTVSQDHSRLEQYSSRETELQSRIVSGQAEVEQLQTKIQELNRSVHDSERSLDTIRQMRLQITEEVSSGATTLAAQKAEHAQIQNTVTGLRDAMNSKRSRLESLSELQRNFEGYGEGVRSVLKRRRDDNDTSLIGTISELITTPTQFEAAVSAVLGERLQYVVVDSPESGVNAIEFLKTAATGRGSFIPAHLLAQTEAGSLLQGEGVVARMLDVVQCRDDVRAVAEYLFANVFVVADLEQAIRLRREQNCRCTLVTLDGDVVDPDGIMTGGRGGDASQQFLSRKREIAELETEVTRLQADVHVDEQRLGKIEHRIQSLTQEVDRLAQDSHSEEIKIVHQEKDTGHLRQELERCQQQRERLVQQLSTWTADLERIQADTVSARERMVAAEAQKVEIDVQLQQLKAQNEELDGTVQHHQDHVMVYRTELARQQQRNQHLSSELQRLQQQEQDACAEIERGVQTIADATTRIESLQASQVEKEVELATILATLSAAQDEQRTLTLGYQEAQDGLRALELRVRELRSGLEKVRAALHEKSLEEVRHSEKRANLERDVFERYHVELSVTPFDAEALGMPIENAVTEVQALKEKIEKLGSVNVDAIVEYAELEQRHQFLTQQCNDLTKSLDDLNKAIQKINRTSKERFREAFDAVNESFQILFPRLFKGGKAKLILTDEENILESGVEIYAQPPGKKLQSVTLLSGGEKALTAVAVIFSIFLIKPSPFCLLDEVDAPLDDVNVDRFNDMIRQMMGHSQFILITHNKRTMELADTLYGVTMQEPGVSRLVSVKLDGQDVESADKIVAA